MFQDVKVRETKHTMKSAFVLFIAEVVATSFLMFLGCMGGVKGFNDQDAPSAQGAVVFGMTVCSLIQMFGHVSGAHMNPVVTLAAWLWGSISLPMSILYFIAQIIGATTGFGLLTALTPDELLYWGSNANGTFCTTAPAPGISTTQAFFGEFVTTGILIFMCCGCWDVRNSALQDGVALKFGVLVAAISIAQGPYTGASMNPARTLGPSIILNKWDRHWIYWVAPLSAGLFVPIVYKGLFNPPRSKADEDMILQPETIAITTKQ